MMENDASPVVPETSLRDALETLAESSLPTLPIVDPETGQVLAVLARPEAVPASPAAAPGGHGDAAGRLPA